MTEILLGFEVGSGRPVHVRLHHLAIFGMTQLSGKTTTLEALISRSGLRAIAFITKRGESGFTRYRLIPAFYRPRADWQYVEGLVNVALGEKVKYEPGMRWAIIKVAKESHNLREVKAKALELKCLHLCNECLEYHGFSLFCPIYRQTLKMVFKILLSQLKLKLRELLKKCLDHKFWKWSGLRW